MPDQSISEPSVERLVVMGVSGSGKSTVGELLASELSVPFVDADDLHPASNKEKMAAGHPLTDEDRWPWLTLVGDALEDAAGGVVVACSSLKRSYRDAIRAVAPDVKFIYLEGSHEMLAARMSHREGHFMPLSLLDSQLATLEPLQSDEQGMTLSIDLDAEEIAKRASRV